MNDNSNIVNGANRKSTLDNNNKNKNNNDQIIVKQEKHDDQEINKLASKLIDANKIKMASLTLQQRNQQTTNSGAKVINRIEINNKTNSSSSSSVITRDKENSIRNLSNLEVIDKDSLKGRFGWTSMGATHIPYIIRAEEKYCSVRMVEISGLNKWLNYLHPDLYNCTNVHSYYVTSAEARLFNEINQKHCDCQFGNELFTLNDLIVKLTDAKAFYDFLGYCYEKLICNISRKMTDGTSRCGFIRINKESVVPYTLVANVKHVPLFYFEGETDNLKRRASKLNGWDLAYLKFCCKVQGIRNELFAHDSCSVISINDIKNYFPPGTEFEDYWPKKCTDSSTQLLIVNHNRMTGNFSSTKCSGVHWTRQPINGPQSQSCGVITTKRLIVPRPRDNTESIQIRTVTNGSSSSSSSSSLSCNNQSIQLNDKHKQLNYSTTKINNNSTIVRSNPYINETNSMNSNKIEQALPPPPLLRPTSNNFGIHYPALHLTNQQIGLNNSTQYKLQKVYIQDKIIDAINMKPNIFNIDHLVLLEDLIKKFFNGVSIEDCKKVLKVLAIDIHYANIDQMHILLKNHKCSSKSRPVPLVHMKNISDFMPQLKYMLLVSSGVEKSQQLKNKQ